MNLGKSMPQKKVSYAHDRLSINEAASSKHLNVIAHYDDATLVDKSGKLISILEFNGIDPVTKSDAFLDALKNRRNHFLKSFSSEFALYFWVVRKKNVAYPAGEFVNDFARMVDEQYKDKTQAKQLYQNRLYMAIITKQPEGMVQKGFDFIKQLNGRLDKESKTKYLSKRHTELQDVIKRTVSVFKEYQPKLLRAYEDEGILFSESLELLSEILNFDNYKVPVEAKNISVSLARKRLFFNRKMGAIEMRAADNHKKFAAVLSVKDYAPFTYKGILDVLNHLRVEYAITQSYRFYDMHVAKTKLRAQQKDMSQSRDESISQTEEISDVFDDTASGEVSYGIHHFALVCYADSIDELNQHVGLIVSKFSDLGMACVREDIACESVFWSQLPGNFPYIVRPAEISTKNMASFASMHNAVIGKIRGNYWDDAVTIFETLSGSPYYFNFHYRDVGNFLVFGTMGSGKTVLVGFLILQSMKFGGKRIIFDKDRGLEILVRAMGGVYDVLKPGIATGFNPCQLSDTPENRKFLSALFRKMLSLTGQVLNEADLEIIEQAIIGLYRLETLDRKLCHLASFFGAKKKGSLRARFDAWHSQGTHAWLFDNEIDNLNLNSDVIGFDLGHILKDSDTKTPALMYLLHRVSQALEGQRGMIFCDEGWKALEDEYFKTILNDWSRTPRKKNNFLGLATQSAEDTVTSSVSKTLNESAACKIFFPNPTANRDIYMNEFGLSQQEYHLVKTLPDNQHYFLLHYGHGKESVVVRANLEGMDDIVAVISARESTIKILDELRMQVGDEPKLWLPLFYERIKKEKPS